MNYKRKSSDHLCGEESINTRSYLISIFIKLFLKWERQCYYQLVHVFPLLYPTLLLHGKTLAPHIIIVFTLHVSIFLTLKRKIRFGRVLEELLNLNNVKNKIKLEIILNVVKILQAKSGNIYALILDKLLYFRIFFLLVNCKLNYSISNS